MAESLYDKYGGFPTVSAVVHAFYDKLLDDDDLADFFDGVPMDRLMDHQVKFLCKVLGGPDNFNGRALKAAHANLDIDEEAFSLVAGHLKETLEESGVEPQDVTTILGIVASTKDDIVTAA